MYVIYIYICTYSMFDVSIMLEYISCFGPKRTRSLIAIMNLPMDMRSFGSVVGDARPIQLNHQHLWHCQGLPLSGPLL